MLAGAAVIHGVDPREHALVAPELFVPDVDAAVRFYEEKLGFEPLRREQEGGRSSFAIVALGEAIVMFADQAHYAPMGGGGIEGTRGSAIDVRFMVEDVDSMYARCIAADVSIALDIADRYYGLRDFIIRDLNGYRLRFAAPLASQAT